MEKRIQKDHRTIISKTSKTTESPIIIKVPQIYGFSYKTIYNKNNIKLPSIKKTANFIADILSQMISNNKNKKIIFSVFNAKKAPKMTIGAYLERISKYSRISYESLILGIIYIDRYINMKEDYFLNDLNVHKFFNKIIFC